MQLFDIIKNTSHSFLVKKDIKADKQATLENISTIEDACHRFNLDLKQDLFRSADYLNYFIAIDDKTRLAVESVSQSFLTININNEENKSRIADAAFLYHRLMFVIYFRLIVTLAPNQHPQLGNLISRAINNATEIIKWRYINYQSAPGNIWLQISSLFELAENAKLTTYTYNPYPTLTNAEYTPNSIQSGYITVNMLGNLEKLSLNPQQIDLMSKALATWSKAVKIEQTYNKNRHMFYVDIDKNTPANKIGNLIPTPASRFWCMDSINAEIDSLINSIKTNETPVTDSIKPLAKHLYALKTLQAVKTEWALPTYKRQRRAHPRVSTDKVASNVFGFEDTYYQIKHYEDALVELKQKSFENINKEQENALFEHEEQAAKPHTESMTAFINMNHGFCNIVDESINGLCMHIEKNPNALSVGMMIGIAIQGNRFGTKIGIIRSINPTENNTLRIGVEIISRNALSISAERYTSSTQSAELEGAPSISKLIDQHKFDEQSDAFNCLLLPEAFSYNKAQSLILPKHRYMTNGQYHMQLPKEVKLIQIKETLEHHDNWVRVYFDELQE